MLDPTNILLNITLLYCTVYNVHVGIKKKFINQHAPFLLPTGNILSINFRKEIR